MKTRFSISYTHKPKDKIPKTHFTKHKRQHAKYKMYNMVAAISHSRIGGKTSRQLNSKNTILKM